MSKPHPKASPKSKPKLTPRKAAAAARKNAAAGNRPRATAGGQRPARAPQRPTRTATMGNNTHPPKGLVLVSAEKLQSLQDRFREAQETLDAIRSGEADAVVVSGPNGSQVYSLAGAEQPYRVYVEQMQEGAVTVTGEGMILYANRRFAEMVRAPLERVISSRITDYLRPDEWATFCAILDTAAGGGAVKHECHLHAPGDLTLPAYIAASRLPLAGQEVLCLVVTDLTEQKKTSELRLAKESAEKANFAKDHFLAALSHELRTPLTPALMAAMNLEHDPLVPDRVRQEVAMIRRNVELEARLIDDLLDLTRIARGKLELHTAPVDVHAALLRAVEICRLDVRARRQELRVHLGGTRTRIQGDPVRLQQAFWNLIRNAVKFTPPAGKIDVRTEDADGGQLRIVVRDTGIGFAQDAAERMFDAFEQGSRQITRQFGGLGLGLAISKSIVEAHGGSIVAHSDGADRGATFTIALPVDPTAPVGVATAPPATANAHRALRILLVEDHKDTRTSMERLLRKYNHEVRTAESARQALEIAAGATFDLVISDLGLPDLSGLELMRQLRDRHQLKGICVSGYGMEDDVANSRRAGFVEHLTKPINLERLKRVIHDVAAVDAEDKPAA
jgi:signal transduction histidine kinase/ActR/RegA family two-component response regulator